MEEKVLQGYMRLHEIIGAYKHSNLEDELGVKIFSTVVRDIIEEYLEESGREGEIK